MESVKIHYFLVLCISAGILVTPLYSWTQDGIDAITVPSADVTLSFVQPGIIDKIFVKEGDIVATGQILIQQDDSAEQAQLSQIRAKSEDTSEIAGAEASLAQKRLVYERLKWAAEHHSATELEIEKARLDVTIAELSLKVAQFEHEQNIRKYNEAKIRVDRMSLKSPIAGRVDKVELEAGESINSLTDAVQVVRTNPLWINVPVPLEIGRKLRLGQVAKVVFPTGDQKPAEGRIIFVSTVADSASDTVRARIEIANPSKRLAGEHVRVIF